MAASKKTSPAKKAAAKKAPAKKAPAKKAAAKKAPAKKAAGEEGSSQEGPGEEGSGQEGPGEEGRQKSGRRLRQEGAGQEGAGEEGPGQEGAGQEGAREEGSGQEGAGEEGAGQEGAGQEGAGEEDSRQEGPSEEGSKHERDRRRRLPPRRRRSQRRPASRSRPSATSMTPSLLSNAKFERTEVPAPRGRTKDGIAYTKDFDVKFLKQQRDELLSRRAAELARATRLEDEATSIIEDGEMGDVQFDDEGGEGDTMVVQRDLDRVLSTQARQTILEIDAALARIEAGTYGYSEVSGLPIQRERLEAIPETTVLAAEKVSGVGPR